MPCSKCVKSRECSHHTHEHEPVCTADKTLVFRACDNAAGRTVTDSKIRGLLNSILPSKDEEGAPSALAEFVFDFDPKRRCGLSEEQLAKLDDHVPMSLVAAMHAFGILDDANLDCWVCGHDASIMPVRCAAPGCKAAAHADCLHVTCPDKATLERLTASAKLACGAHKHLKPRWDKLVSTDPDDPPCALCGEGIAKPDLIRCAHEGCQAYHVNCLPGVSLRAKVDLRAFKFNCLSDAHCRPKFVGQ